MKESISNAEVEKEQDRRRMIQGKKNQETLWEFFDTMMKGNISHGIPERTKRKDSGKPI